MASDSDTAVLSYNSLVPINKHYTPEILLRVPLVQEHNNTCNIDRPEETA